MHGAGRQPPPSAKKDDEEQFFEVNARHIDTLIAEGLLRPSQRHDEDAVFAAVTELLERATIELETNGSEPLPATHEIPKTKPVSSVRALVPKVKPVNQVMVSPSAQQLLNELAIQEFLIAMVEYGFIPAEKAVDVWDRVFAKARAMNAYAATIQAAQFNRDMLLWEMAQKGLI
jgi:hypothetical protein